MLDYIDEKSSICNSINSPFFCCLFIEGIAVNYVCFVLVIRKHHFVDKPMNVVIMKMHYWLIMMVPQVVSKSNMAAVNCCKSISVSFCSSRIIRVWPCWISLTRSDWHRTFFVFISPIEYDHFQGYLGVCSEKLLNYSSESIGWFPSPVLLLHLLFLSSLFLCRFSFSRFFFYYYCRCSSCARQLLSMQAIDSRCQHNVL